MELENNVDFLTDHQPLEPDYRPFQGFVHH